MIFWFFDVFTVLKLNFMIIVNNEANTRFCK